MNHQEKTMTIRTAARRHRLAFVTAGVGLLVAVGLAVPAPASAHTGAASAVASCPAPATGTGRIVYTVSNDHPLVATVTASDNAAVAVGATIPKSGSKSFTQTVPAPAAGVTGSANLTVRWSDGFTQSGIVASATVGADCTGPVTVVVPELPVLPPTCTEPGSLPWTSNPPAQNANGYEFPGQGYRAYLDHAYVGAGTYVVTVQKVGAGFDAAFPNGTKVTGATSQTLTVLPAIGNQTADASAPCFTRPEQPEPKVTYTEWKDAENNCTVDVIVQTRDMVTTTYTWNESEGEYVASVVTEQEVQQRAKTDQEKDACVIVTPPTDEPTPPTDQPTEPAPSGTPQPTTPPTGPTSQPSPASTSTPTAAPATSQQQNGTPQAAVDTLAYTGSSPLLLGAGIAGVLAAAVGATFLLILSIRRQRRNVENHPDDL